MYRAVRGQYYFQSAAGVHTVYSAVPHVTCMSWSISLVMESVFVASWKGLGLYLGENHKGQVTSFYLFHCSLEPW